MKVTIQETKESKVYYKRNYIDEIEEVKGKKVLVSGIECFIAKEKFYSLFHAKTGVSILSRYKTKSQMMLHAQSIDYDRLIEATAKVEKKYKKDLVAI